MRVWAEITLEHLAENLTEIRRCADGTAVMAVVKADAYGHGAAVVASYLQDIGVERFAVSSLDEAAELRAAGITIPIMNMGYASPSDAAGLLNYDIVQAVYDARQGRELGAAAERLGARLKVHFKIDTGMSRLGFMTGDAYEIAAIAAMRGLDVEGVFTHFATSDVPGDEFQKEQLAKFTALVDELAAIGLGFRYVHASNSGGVINIPDARFNLIRPGIMLYGVLPVPGLPASVKPVMRLRAKLAQVHEYNEPMSASYGRTFRSDGPIRTGTVTIGYGDGLHRVLSNKMSVLVNGYRAKQIGNICMDMMIIDLSGVPNVKAGDDVTIFGSDGDDELKVEDLAQLAGTIPYELLCAHTRRVERIYL